MTWTKRDEGFLRRINKAEAAIQRVREVHSRNKFGECEACADSRYASWPCPTIDALDGAK